jgi:hypothetical protein
VRENPHEIRIAGLLTLKNSSFDWYKKAGRVKRDAESYVGDPKNEVNELSLFGAARIDPRP